MQKFKYKNYRFGSEFILIAGNCVIETSKIVFKTLDRLMKVTDDLGIKLIYKISYDKANRTSIDSYRGPGLEQSIKIISKIRDNYNVGLLTDVHNIYEIDMVKEYVDFLQIPAFLSRQTDLITTAAATKLCINIKKGQFMSPYSIQHAVKKVSSKKNTKVFVTERGTSFGYNNLVVDMTSFDIIHNSAKVPVIFDATHSVQVPGNAGKKTGGNRKFILSLAKAAVSAGADGIYMETHPNPDKAKSDKDSQFPLKKIKEFLKIINDSYLFNNK